MFYIDQLHKVTFLSGLVKTESGFILRSVETGLERWMLMVAVISVDPALLMNYGHIIKSL